MWDDLGSSYAKDLGKVITYFLRQWLPTGRLAKNTFLVMFWQGGRIAAQALWLVLIARTLGPEEYGTFSGIAGLGAALGSFAGFGLGLVMYQEVTRQPAIFGEYWRRTLVVTAASGILFAIAFALFGDRVFGDTEGWLTIAAIALSELFCFPLGTAAIFAFSAHERMGWSAALSAILASLRVVAVTAFYFLAGTQTLAVYVWFHTAAAALFASLAILLVQVLLRPAAAPLILRWQDLRDGLGFSAVWVTSNALTSLDKALALRLAGDEVAGIYTSAYRFAAILALPMDSLAAAALPRLFRGSHGAAANPRLVPSLLLVTFVYSLLAGTGLWLLADLLPLLLGKGFAAAAHAARWMGLFLPCYGLRVLGGNLLMAGGHKTQRVLMESGSLVSLVLFGGWWLPRFGLDGAVMMVIATEALLCIATWALLLFRRGFNPSNALNTLDR
ncbi:Polysaccharide biosynthesis protein [Gammaproteobacteria bacterium]